MFGFNDTRYKALMAEYDDLKAGTEVMLSESGVGLWRCKLHEGDISHPKSDLRWSDGMRKIFGYENEIDYPNTVSTWGDKIHPDEREATFKAFAAHSMDTTGRTPFNVEYRYRMKDGSYRWFNARGGSIRGADGIATWSCGSIVDIHELKMGQERMEASLQKQNDVVKMVSNALRQLADGNLTSRLPNDFPAGFEELRDNCNIAFEMMQKALRDVADKALSIRSGTAEISSATDNLSKRTERQAAALEETSAALDEVTENVRKTASGATHAKNVVSNTMASAIESGQVVEKAVQAMENIEQSSRQVNSIIGVIDEIAFQTNLLALNAGVEAARAGDAGRGFAVVASEVRGLAQRSAEAAKEIKSLISLSGQQVGRGVELVAKTGDELKRILSQVDSINAIVTDITAAAEEQASSLQQISVAFNQMDQDTQQNAAMSEESSSATRMLDDQADELSTLVRRFQLGDKAYSAQASYTPVADRQRRYA